LYSGVLEIPEKGIIVPNAISFNDSRSVEQLLYPLVPFTILLQIVTLVFVDVKCHPKF
jgi:hypothetical protein